MILFIRVGNEHCARVAELKYISSVIKRHSTLDPVPEKNYKMLQIHVVILYGTKLKVLASVINIFF